MDKIILAIFTISCLLPSCCSPKINKQDHHYQESNHQDSDGGQHTRSEYSYTNNDGKHHHSSESKYYNEHSNSSESPDGKINTYYRETTKTKRYHSIENSD